MRWFSLEGKLAFLLLAVAAIGAALGAVAQRMIGSQWWAVLLAVVIAILLALWLSHLICAPIAELFRTLSGAVVSFRDGDFSFSIHSARRDEIGDLVTAHNELGRVLRDERQNLFQRELLLHTVVQNTPTALLLVDDHGHIVYSNTAARQMFNAGKRLEGMDFDTVLSESSGAMTTALASAQDSIFSATLDGHEEAFHLAQRRFQLNGRHHRLLLVKRMTRELSRQEVATWKKVIRVISHELNNSLAPISSLAHSGRELAAVGALDRLTRVFDTIEERALHLDAFIRGYAAFAKLPTPRLESVRWPPFLSGLAAHQGFRVIEPVPAQAARFDPAQLSQVLINLLKNAHESGSAAEGIELEVGQQAGQWRIEVRDRGSGMSEQVMANALVPFYSTKRSGTGLGLALAREIVEAHNGRIALSNREGGGLVVSLFLPLE